ncbi:MAG: zinc-ribbon domain containing protein [Pseudomonadota bacterium]
MGAKKAEARAARRRKRMQRAFRRVPRRGTYVDHPRYGNRPILSDERWTETEVRRAFWQYGRARIFPETAIRADLTRQNYGFSPRRCYVDIAERCRSCGREFLWFALEQKHWFEELGFFIDAQCHHCQDCRHISHKLRERRQAYDALIAKADKTTAEWERLERLGKALWDAGAITKPETLLKSRMPKRLRRRL